LTNPNVGRAFWPAMTPSGVISRAAARPARASTRNLKSLVPLALILCLFSCSAPRVGGNKQYFVAFSQCNNAEPYRAAQNALMTRLFAAYPDVKLVIADAQQDNSKQVAQVETFIRQKPDLLIVAPNERAALTAVMGQAMEAKIPTICLERDILQPNYTTYIRSDNAAIGRMAGGFIVDYLKRKYGEPKGRIVQMRGLLGVEGEINRDGGAANTVMLVEVGGSAGINWMEPRDFCLDDAKANRASSFAASTFSGHWGTNGFFFHNTPSGFTMVSFADGHTETHRWLEPTTLVPLGQAEGVTHTSATDRDVKWLHDHCTYWLILNEHRCSHP